MAYRAVSTIPTLLIMCFTSFFVLSGCDQSTELPLMEAAPVIDETKTPIWLDGRVDMSPQQWLIKRSTETITDEKAQAEQAEKLLIIASNKFDENPRMVANRVAQLEDMLLEHNINETAVHLLEWFTQLPNTKTPHNFSALCQYYYNLRIQGKSKDEIIHSILHT
ncbi:hypothetical protein LCGC14_0741330 [marine sediment metagenome]|uniref:Uncharacterized protein n=1 Tax=marine sediment metagenome TaxID=412755 RepID=A0A0F9QRN2_9ZZZZ